MVATHSRQRRSAASGRSEWEQILARETTVRITNVFVSLLSSQAGDEMRFFILSYFIFHSLCRGLEAFALFCDDDSDTHGAAKLLQMMHCFNLLPSKRDDPGLF